MVPSQSLLMLGVAVALAAVAARPPQGRGGETGRIEGTVRLSPTLASRKPRVHLYGDYGPGSVPPLPPSVTNEYANVVIYIDSVPAPDTTVSGHPTMAQQNETFVPHVLPIVKGTTVAFPNDDPLFHNVFSLSAARSFDLGRYPKGTSKAVQFDRAGIVQVFCHIHADMSAIVVVLDNPFFTVPRAGHYAIDDVPPGDYRVVAWHERIKPIVEHAHVEPGRTTLVDLNVPLPPADARP